MNCHVKRNNKVYATAQPMEETMSQQDESYAHSLAVAPQMCPVQHSCGCGHADIQPAPWPDYDPAPQHDYMQFNGYLRANIGNLMMVEFSCGGLSGDCSMWEKTGVLTEVGDDYIVLSDPEGCGKTMCDLNAIKFVNIMPKPCECDCCCPKQEQPAPAPAPAPQNNAADEHFNCNLYNTNVYNADQYRNYIMP